MVGDDLTALVVLRVEGGPGAMALDIRSAGVPWCVGISITGAEPAGLVWCPAVEPGDDVRFTAVLTTVPWEGHDRVVLPVWVTATTNDGRRWERRVSIPLVPPPAPHGAYLA